MNSIVKKNKLFYLVPDKNIIIIWTPRAGCSFVSLMYYKQLGLLDNIYTLYNNLKHKPLSIPIHWYYEIHKKI